MARGTGGALLLVVVVAVVVTVPNWMRTRNVAQLHMFWPAAARLQLRGFVVVPVVGNRARRRGPAAHRRPGQAVLLEGLVPALAQDRPQHEHVEGGAQ